MTTSADPRYVPPPGRSIELGAFAYVASRMYLWGMDLSREEFGARMAAEWMALWGSPEVATVATAVLASIVAVHRWNRTREMISR